MPRKYIWNKKYTIELSIDHSQRTKCIQYNLYEIESCELPNVFKSLNVKRCIGFVLSNSVNEKNVYMFSYVFQKSCWFPAIKSFKCQKKKNIWNAKYTIQHRIECSQTTKCIQYNIHDTKSCELPNYYVCKSP